VGAASGFQPSPLSQGQARRATFASVPIVLFLYLRRNSALRRTMARMAVALRDYDPRDFSALFRLDHSCFAEGISYSKSTLRYFLELPSADCVIAQDGKRIVGFVLSEENPPLAHIITLDIAETHRRQGIGSSLLAELERNLALRGVRAILLETAIDNEAAVAFWKRRGYRIEAVLKRYYLRRLDAYEMRKKFSVTGTSAPAQKET